MINNSRRINTHVLGHIFALITAFIWGITFVTSKTLLNAGLSPFETTVLRFAIAYVALWLIRPRLLPFKGLRNELPFMLCGLFGVAIYYMFEYYSLLLSSANLTGIITGMAPLIVALMMWVVYKERPKKLFVLGFFVAIVGITLISIGGGEGLQFSLPAAALAFGGTVVWASYCASLRKIDAQVDSMLSTRRIFFWALVFMLPLMFILDFNVSDVNFLVPDVILSLLLLGIIASAICYFLYNYATNKIGAVKTSAYIYFSPVVNAVGAYLVLGEQLQWGGIAGIAIIILGLILSERGE